MAARRRASVDSKTGTCRRQRAKGVSVGHALVMPWDARRRDSCDRCKKFLVRCLAPPPARSLNRRRGHTSCMAESRSSASSSATRALSACPTAPSTALSALPDEPPSSLALPSLSSPSSILARLCPSRCCADVAIFRANSWLRLKGGSGENGGDRQPRLQGWGSHA